MNRMLPFDQVRQDVRSAARSLRRYPIAAAVAIVSLAGGIGATTVTLTHVFIAPAVIVTLIAALATWVPSRRAALIDPSVLLRSLRAAARARSVSRSRRSGR